MVVVNGSTLEFWDPVTGILSVTQPTVTVADVIPGHDLRAIDTLPNGNFLIRDEGKPLIHEVDNTGATVAGGISLTPIHSDPRGLRSYPE